MWNDINAIIYTASCGVGSRYPVSSVGGRMTLAILLSRVVEFRVVRFSVVG